MAPAFGGTFALVDALGPEAAPRAQRSWVKQGRWMQAASEPAPEPGAFALRYRVPLIIERVDSQLPVEELELVLTEINAIWDQAGICFEMRDARLGPLTGRELVLRFVGGDDGSTLYGMYDGDRAVWSRDRPGLEPSPHGTAHPAAHTASHELGHALSLRHANRRSDSIDQLMASGRRGFRLQPKEIALARKAASVIGEPDGPCGEPKLL